MPDVNNAIKAPVPINRQRLIRTDRNTLMLRFALARDVDGSVRTVEAL